MTNPKPLLELTTDRNFIDVGGKSYFIRNLGEFSIREQQKVSLHGKRITKIFNSEEEISEATEAEAHAGLNDLFSRIVIDGAELTDKLSDGHKLKVLMAFLKQDDEVKKAMTSASTETPSNAVRG